MRGTQAGWARHAGKASLCEKENNAPPTCLTGAQRMLGGYMSRGIVGIVVPLCGGG